MKTELEGLETLIPVSARLRRRVSRLRHITGFVTTFGEDSDPRIGVFARIWHVARVASVARFLAEESNGVDPARVGRLAWIHDLNRWPFAHNSERGNFDQSLNVADYFTRLDVPRQDISDLEGIHRKDLYSLTPEGRVVLFADALTGIVEDLLMAVTGLNVHPRLIPAEVDALLGFSLKQDPWLSRCHALADCFHRSLSPDVEYFQEAMGDLFEQLITMFVSRHKVHDVEHDYPVVYNIAYTVKETFTRRVIFPINNERVCHSSWLRESVFPWYFRTAGGDVGHLLEIDEPQFVQAVTTMPGSPFTPDEFIPDIDIVKREIPQLAFVN
ncbi:hypothetical protein [Microbispora bryophytorum]|uniref:HD domain-containing protein n=1 Tax=Microbispora bryophytorum subsp. camponoti TaxID=1677852 RepID=A0ABR8LBI5_9ACTN|nr:hypothetical protein [Microbispora camponoti]MBD3148237.1 hypothetical protein [Microbispora camponoti]